jgi:hypothetical protein
MRQIVYCLMLVAIWLCSMASADAQCPPDAKIYIDPRLVPQRPQISRNAMRAWLGIGDPALLSQLYMMYQQQGQPIEVPYGEGKVLVHPTNPCIQQYIP